MSETTWMRAVALAAISIPALAFGQGPLPAGHDDATYSEDAPEARLATDVGASGTWGPMAPGHDDAVYPGGTIGLQAAPMAVAVGPLPAGRDDATYGTELPVEQVPAPAQAVAVVSQANEGQPPARYDPTWPDGLAPGEDGAGWATPDNVQVAGTQYDPTAPDGDVPGLADESSPARVVELHVTEKGFEPAEVVLERGHAVKLVVTRMTERTCARRIVVEGQDIDAPLPLGQAVTLPLLPRENGHIHYACATGKVGGSLIVR